MRDREGWVCAIFNILLAESLEKSYFGWFRDTQELLTYSAASASLGVFDA